ncbi:ComF family protein [Algoriphagus sp. CAU 1675]|nr:ComF family protein [Algoriphagus sp. CAU 1675]MDF2156403.1 ComF family protein [Algoriphagus sp. CAU 1675]
MRLLFWKDFFDLIFPRNCLLCGRNLFDQEECLCSICKGTLPETSYHLRPFDNDITSKIKGLTQVGLAISYLRFTKAGKTQKLLHQLKYQDKPELAEVLGKWYGEKLLSYQFSSTWDVITSVPLHEMKKLRRGYNQSEEFGKGLSKVLGIPYQNLLNRKKYTETQTKKTRLERLDNVNEVFQVSDIKLVKAKNILLVDDVITTGATLCSCTNLLLANGANNVDLATIAAGGSI